MSQDRLESVRKELAHATARITRRAEQDTATVLLHTALVELLIKKNVITDQELASTIESLTKRKYKDLPNGQRIYENEVGYANINIDPQSD